MTKSFAIAALLLAAATLRADDWPKFLGPSGDQIVREKINLDWPAAGPRELWRIPMGKGFSSPVVANNVLYINVNDGPNELLYALDANTGKEIWKSPGSPAWNQGGPMAYPGTRATPAIDGDFIYTYSGHAQLTCRKLADGKIVWQTDVLKDTKAKDLQWGTAASPLIVGDSIFVQGGQNAPIAAAINKKTGEYIWKAETGVGAYATPVLAKIDNVDQLILVGGKFVFSLDPATGKTLWSHPWETYFQINAASPVIRDNKILLAGAYAHGALQLQAAANSAAVAWKKESTFLAKFPTPLLLGDVLIGNSEGKIMALDWNSGKQLWAANEKIGEGGSLVPLGDKNILALSDTGNVTLFKLTDKGLEKTAAFKAASGKNIWSTPTISGGKLFVKGESDLACFDVAAK